MSTEVMSAKEREYLRELAKKQLSYANLPVMEERKKLWYLHNSLQGPRPMVVMEEATFLEEILPRPSARPRTESGWNGSFCRIFWPMSWRMTTRWCRTAFM